MASGNSLDAIEPFLGELMDAVEPGQRKRLADKIMRAARRANVQRIAANVTPDDTAMAPRKKRETGKKGRAKRGKMFRHIGKHLKIRTTPDTGELYFDNRLVEHTAATHHYGLEGFVGRTRKGKVIRTKYQARPLLGFGPEQQEFLDVALKHLEGG